MYLHIIIDRSSGEFPIQFSMWPQVSVPLISRPVARTEWGGTTPFVESGGL